MPTAGTLSELASFPDIRLRILNAENGLLMMMESLDRVWHTTPAVMEDLAILGVLAANMPGSSAMQPELVVMHHTDCGMSRLAKPALQEQVAKRLGLSVDEVAAMAITDPAMSVQADIERLRKTPGTPDQLVVSGFVYDAKNGTINQVLPPAPLRTTT